MTVDLHIHSKASSDGEFSARELVLLAQKKRLKAIAIADHESVNSVEEGIYWGQKFGVEVLPACEFVCHHHGIILHMLGYCFDLKNPRMLELFKKVEQDRVKVIDLQIDALRNAGYYLDKDKVFEDCNYTTPLGGNYVNVIFADSKNKDHPVIKEYLKRPNHVVRFLFDYLNLGKPLYIPQFNPTAVEVIALYREAGGVPILAHPGSNLKPEETWIIDDLLMSGLAGLEVYTSHHDEWQELYYMRYCQDHGLIYTCGSDYHGRFKPGIEMGNIKENSYAVVDSLKSKMDS